MSAVLWLAADFHLPQVAWSNIELYPGGMRLDPHGYAVGDGSYYANSWDLPDFVADIPPCRYDFEWDDRPQSLEGFRQYLLRNVPPGARVELWHFWLGDESLHAAERERHTRTTVAALSAGHLAALRNRYGVCLTILNAP